MALFDVIDLERKAGARRAKAVTGNEKRIECASTGSIPLVGGEDGSVKIILTIK
jgi:hypothetical protein